MKRHSFDPVSMAAGVVFLLLAVTAAGSGRFNYRIDEWVFPVALLVLGIGILSATLRGLKSQQPAETQSADTEAGVGENHLN